MDNSAFDSTNSLKVKNKKILKTAKKVHSILSSTTDFWQSSSPNKSAISSEKYKSDKEPEVKISRTNSCSHLNSTCSNICESFKDINMNYTPEESDTVLLPSFAEKVSDSSHQKKKRNRKTNKKRWRRIEDIKIIELVENYGTNWDVIRLNFPERTLEEIKERFTNAIAGKLKFHKFTEEEDKLILNLHNIYGNRWIEIAKKLKHRTHNMIKNRYYSHLKNKSKNFNYEPVFTKETESITEDNHLFYSEKLNNNFNKELYNSGNLFNNINEKEMNYSNFSNIFTHKKSECDFENDNKFLYEINGSSNNSTLNNSSNLNLNKQYELLERLFENIVNIGDTQLQKCELKGKINLI